MALIELAADAVRCLRDVELQLSPSANFVFGDNGAGKTSLLEAIYLLGRGRSFRTRLAKALRRHDAERLWVHGRNDRTPPDRGGIELDRREGTRARLNGAVVQSLAELATAFPVQVIDPDIHKWVEEGASRRRRWFDWGVFHVEPQFLSDWSRYTRAVRQRNSALRAGGDPIPWEHEIAERGEALSAHRSRFFDWLEPVFRSLEAELVGLGLELRYYRGWPAQEELAMVLAKNRQRDRSVQITSVGAHRADLQLRLSGRPAREVLSRGQQKLAAIALTLAQLEVLKQQIGLKPTLLLDDPAAELDASRLAVFFERIQSFDTQLIVTSLTSRWPGLSPPDVVFHVERGRVIRL
ncbi:MAG: DNA replication/repair protein RecF [Steroidobacteraceae bacterium]|nr:DNA replication/repair protein RecF [Steroidobacteraceae bacterium]MDW8260562.1 DNA replication/repair protein RecF [Gammaproteobacteria bacterium]